MAVVGTVCIGAVCIGAVADTWGAGTGSGFSVPAITAGTDEAAGKACTAFLPRPTHNVLVHRVEVKRCTLPEWYVV